MEALILKIRNILKCREGVFLMELIVAISVFIILISIAVGSLIQSIRTQRIALALIAANDSVSLTLEQMAREMRTGYLFCTAGIPAATTTNLGCGNLNGDIATDYEIQFVNANGAFVRYRLNNFALERGIVDSSCEGGFCYQPITADNVKVAAFIVKLAHSEVDGYPPRITLIMSVTSREPDVESLNIFADIQTTISPRCGQSGCPSDI